MKKKILNQIQHFPKKNKRNPKKYKKLIKKNNKNVFLNILIKK